MFHVLRQVAYDLRHAAQYIIASPTEIMGTDSLRYCGPALFQETLDPQAICSRLCRSLPKPDDAGKWRIGIDRAD